jgi:two-component system, NtrC family, response regulator AtoC
MKQSHGTHCHRVAVIDDEPVACREIKRGLEKDHHQVSIFHDGESAVKELTADPRDLVLCDLRLPGMDGLQVLKKIKRNHPRTEVIIITAYSTVETAIEAIRAGAFHYVTKPVKLAELRSLVFRSLEKVRLVKEKESLKKALFSMSRKQDLIGSSRAIREVQRLVRKVADLNCNVLIQGESGTGKEIVARSLHFQSTRRGKPFVSFNCGGFTEELIANELFGHEKGAFTGAVDTKVGLLEASQKGTIFLDEIGEMPTSMQVKLLRFVQERTVLRVGGIKPIPVDVRLIAASNQDLKTLVREKMFREDLYFRLNVVLISLPPLRSRTDDIPILINYFLAHYSAVFGKHISGLDPDAMEILLRYPFPGNVRELENIIERTVALSDGPVIRPKDLPSDLQQLSISTLDNGVLPSLEEKEKEYIHQVLIHTNFKKGLAAEILKLPRTTLWRKMKRFGLT